MRPIPDYDEHFMLEAINLAKQSIRDGGGPFGCVIVRNGEVIGRGHNRVTMDNDPTAHAEVTAIRDACKYLDDFQLKDCAIYASCEPCPMCLGAIYWARPAVIYYATNQNDAALAGFDDSHIYQQINVDPRERDIPMLRHIHLEADEVFRDWSEYEGKREY